MLNLSENIKDLRRLSQNGLADVSTKDTPRLLADMILLNKAVKDAVSLLKVPVQSMLEETQGKSLHVIDCELTPKVLKLKTNSESTITVRAFAEKHRIQEKNTTVKNHILLKNCYDNGEEVSYITRKGSTFVVCE